jgi:hypothetical protein
MQDTQTSTEAFRFYRWAEAVAARSDLSPTMKLVGYALAGHANTKTGLCCPSRKTLAAAIGAKRQNTVSEATAGLVRAGLLAIEHGSGNRASYVLLSATADVQKSASADVSGTAERTSDVRQSGHPTRNYEENCEGKMAPGGAAQLARPTDPAGGRTEEIIALVGKLAAARTKVAPGTPSRRDRDAAADLARRLDRDDWRDQIDLAMRVGLDGSAFMRGQVVSVAGLARHIDELLARDLAAETGPPPAAWDPHGCYGCGPDYRGVLDADGFCGDCLEFAAQQALRRREARTVPVERGAADPGDLGAERVEADAADVHPAMQTVEAATGAAGDGQEIHAGEATSDVGGDVLIVTSNAEIAF